MTTFKSLIDGAQIDPTNVSDLSMLETLVAGMPTVYDFEMPGYGFTRQDAITAGERILASLGWTRQDVSDRKRAIISAETASAAARMPSAAYFSIKG